ncbi:WGR domain-containing protein [Nannocystis pusilla]|uniref:WGR domain-containing protein n=1 Tax=Nannocystis pusilla TaxID=889268 RepID=UPI003DA4B939
MARRFEMEEGGSRKFWEIAIEGHTVTVRYGRIGTDGQTKVKQHGTPEEAAKDAAKLVAEKTKKGYVEAPGAGASANEAPKPASANEAPKPASANEAPKPASANEAAAAPASPPKPVGPQFARLYTADGYDEVTWVCTSTERRRRVDPDAGSTIAALVRGWRIEVRSREAAEALLARVAALPGQAPREPAALLAYTGWEISQDHPRSVVVGAILAARGSDIGPDDIFTGAKGPGGASPEVVQAREAWADGWIRETFAGFSAETEAPPATYFVAAGDMGDAYLVLGRIGAKVAGLPFSKRTADANGKKHGDGIAGILLAHAAWDEAACVAVDLSEAALAANLAKVTGAAIAKPLVVIAANYDSRS